MSSYGQFSSSNSGSNGMSSSSSSTSTGGFPLRTNFFRSLPLSKDTIESLYHSAKQNANACLSQSFNDQWRYVPPEKDGTQLRKDTSNLSASFRLVRAATVLRCQEHEVNMVISNTNTESWREFMRKCFGKHYLDTMILHSFMNPVEKATPVGMEVVTNKDHGVTAAVGVDNNRNHRVGSQEDKTEGGEEDGLPPRQTIWLTGPVDLDGDESDNNDQERRNSDTRSVPSDDESSEDFDELLTVKWGALDAGSGGGKRDLCLMDYLSTGYIPNTENKERVHLWCFSSVEGERVGCMALKDTHGISRTTLTKLGVFWRKINEEETEVIACGSFPSKHAKYVSALLLQSLHRLQGIVEDLRLSNQIYVHRSTWVKDHERSSCHLCMRNFYALRRKHHCRKCGEVICSDCSVVENVDLPVIGYSKLRLCKVCCLKAKSTPLKRDDKSNVFDQMVRARSLSNMNASSPYGARMSFVDTGSSNCSLVTNTKSMATTATHSTSQASSSNAQGRHGSAASNGLRSEQLIEASTRSSSSCTSSNNNDSEGLESFEEEFTHLHASSAAVYPIPSEMEGRSGAPTIAHSDDFDDFIDARCLNKQLSAMEMKQNAKNGGCTSNSNMFDLLCELACQTLNCPIASVSIVDAQGNSIRSATGLSDGSGLDEELVLFIDKVMGSTPTIVLDANVDKHVMSLFRKRPPTIRFFAGCPIYSRTGKKLGYICVADATKRDALGASCAFTMERLATLAVTTMERNIAKQQAAAEPPTYASNNQASHQHPQQYAGYSNSPKPSSSRMHPATIFDRPGPRNRQNSTQNGYPQPMHARVYDLSDPELSNSPVYSTSASPAPPVAPMPRSYGEYSAGYYEAQERMRKLLLKSYHTQQQLASGGSMPMPPPTSSSSSSSSGMYH